MFANMLGKIRVGGGGGRREYGENAGGAVDATHVLLAGGDFSDNGNHSDDDRTPHGQDEKVPWGEFVCVRGR
jgi:hypothetical protein